MDKYQKWGKVCTRMLIEKRVRETLRKGQRWMIALHEVDPDYYDAITGTELDCFYDDSKCGAFLEALKKHWEV